MQCFAKCINSKIFIKCGILEKIPHLIMQNFTYDKAIILIDQSVFLIYKTAIEQLCSSLINSYYIICDAGEDSKSLEYVHSLIEKITSLKPTKKSLIIAIGGGTIGDISGFIASIINRGIKLIQIPTTLMAQIDSSIGGKNGINFKQIKNKIGTIYFPEFIIIDPYFLSTLDNQEIISGLIEVIKHGLIDNYNLLKPVVRAPDKINNQDTKFLNNFIKQAAKVKIKIVNQDPYEKLGIRYNLNLGHSFGHAIEGFCNEKQLKITHGEAVAIGLNIVYKLAYQASYLSNLEQLNQVIKIFTILEIDYTLNKVCKKVEDIDIIINYLLHDKKNSYNISLILPTDSGIFKIIDNLSLSFIKNFLVNEFYSLNQY